MQKCIYLKTQDKAKMELPLDTVGIYTCFFCTSECLAKSAHMEILELVYFDRLPHLIRKISVYLVIKKFRHDVFISCMFKLPNMTWKLQIGFLLLPHLTSCPVT